MCFERHSISPCDALRADGAHASGDDGAMDLLRLLADQRCAGCGVRGAVLCRACRGALPWLAGPLCLRCGEPEPQPTIRCPVCRRLGVAVGTVRSAIALAGVGDALMHCWKDGARAPLAEFAAACVVAAVPRPAVDLVVPIPGARSRVAWRGVDGPTDLARLLADRWHLPVWTDALERIHDRPQRGLSAAQRQRNASGAFAARSRVGGRVLLVDDVMTTGATLRAGVRQLRQAGAERVDVITFARVVTTL